MEKIKKGDKVIPIKTVSWQYYGSPEESILEGRKYTVAEVHYEITNHQVNYDKPPRIVLEGVPSRVFKIDQFTKVDSSEEFNYLNTTAKSLREINWNKEENSLNNILERILKRCHDENKKNKVSTIYTLDRWEAYRKHEVVSQLETRCFTVSLEIHDRLIISW